MTPVYCTVIVPSTRQISLCCWVCKHSGSSADCATWKLCQQKRACM